jgi:lysophospholipase
MGFKANYKLEIPQEEEFPDAIVKMEAALADCRTVGNLQTPDGIQLYYEYFTAENSIGSVVIVHGLSEFTKKFYELSYHLLNQGYNVFLYDQRCHGFSQRLTDQMDLIHIHSFDDLVSDLALYIDTVVRKVDARPLMLYGHSMGGAVSALYLATTPQGIHRAVLTSPLVVPVTNNLPGWWFRLSTGFFGRIRGFEKKFFFSREYNPNYTVIPTPGYSHHRVVRSFEMRVQEPHYRSTPLSVGCVRQCLLLRKKLLKCIGNNRTPVLMLCAENDKTVLTKPQAELAAAFPHCEYVVMKDADHAMMTGSHAIVIEHITRTLAHFQSPAL